MSNQQFPPGWDEDHVKGLISNYDQMDDNELTAEVESAVDAIDQDESE